MTMGKKGVKSQAAAHIGIGTDREVTRGTYTLDQIYKDQTLDRMDYRGKPETWASGYYIDDNYAEGTDEAGGVNQARSSPVQIAPSYNIVKGSYASRTNTQTALFLIDDQNRLFSYGENSNGWQGRFNIATGNQINGSWREVQSNGLYRAYGIQTDGTLWSWGYNNGGQLGLNDRNNRSSPQKIGSDTDWMSIHSWQNGDHSPVMFARKSNYMLYSWGGGDGWGKLGHNENIYRSSPVQLGNNTQGQWVDFHQGRYNCWGIQQETNGERNMHVWGEGPSGQLSQGNRSNRSSPYQVGGSYWAKCINLNDAQNSYGIRTDGSHWMWGNNSYGQLGQGDRYPRSSPVLLPGNYDHIVSKSKTVWAFGGGTNTVWAWGRNDGPKYCGVPFGNSVWYPMQIPGEWDRRYGIGTNGTTMFLVKSDDYGNSGLWGWGKKNYGQLGILNNQSDWSFPQHIFDNIDMAPFYYGQNAQGLWPENNGKEDRYRTCYIQRRAGMVPVYSKNRFGHESWYPAP